MISLVKLRTTAGLLGISYNLKTCGRAMGKRLRCLGWPGESFLLNYQFLLFNIFRVGVTEDLKIQKIEVFYDPETFIKVVLNLFK